MMNLLTPESLAELVSAQQPPCLSLYQPTHRHHPDNQQDPIRFGNLVKQLAASLLEKHSPAEAQPLLEPFEALARDRTFWDHTLDGLAVLSGSGLLRVFLLQRPVDELVVVADSFHTKPLRCILQSLDRYQVLELSRQHIRLFEGNRDALDEIELAPGVPRTIEDALGGELTEPQQKVSSHGGVGQGHQPMHHSTGGKKDEVDLDAEKYFRAVDRAVLEWHSNPSGLPLILAALPEHHHLFHAVSNNPFLVADGITLNTAALPLDELRVLAWQTIEPEYQARLTTLVEEFEQARAKQLGSDDLAQVAEAAVNGRVATLLIEADRQLAGRMDSTTGRIEFAGLSHPEVDDLLDDLGEMVAKAGGRVVVMPSQRMPTQTGVAAVFRF
ncbi:MAG: hypothetical protein Q8N33_05600 [Rhodocyclaceae bacterium]|nr:hypothetical protein [Rhodocyclaceae bacterium]